MPWAALRTLTDRPRPGRAAIAQRTRDAADAGTDRVERAGGEHRRRRGGPGRGAPGLLRVRDLRRHRADVEEHRGEVDPRDAVDHRVVGLRDQREPVARPRAPRARHPRSSRAPTAASCGRAAGRRCARRGRISWPSAPGSGSALWRTWNSRLKRGSSTHSGRPDSKRGKGEPLPVARHEVQAAPESCRGTPRRAAAALRRWSPHRRACASSRAPGAGRRRRSRSAGRSAAGPCAPPYTAHRRIPWSAWL